MSNLELIVKDIEGVEFYTDAKTGRSGISQSGLAILCGVDEKSIRNAINSTRTSKPYKGLEHLVDKVLECRTKTETGMWLCNDELCIAIIRYYDRKGNQKAQYTFDKFAAIGFNAWVQSITGWQPPQTLPTAVEERIEKVEQRLEDVVSEVTQVHQAQDAQAERIDRLSEEVAELPKRPKNKRFFVSTREEALEYYPEQYVDSAVWRNELGNVSYYVDLELIDRYNNPDKYKSVFQEPKVNELSAIDARIEAMPVLERERSAKHERKLTAREQQLLEEKAQNVQRIAKFVNRFQTKASLN